jgi:hypothetical protein
LELFDYLCELTAQAALEKPSQCLQKPLRVLQYVQVTVCSEIFKMYLLKQRFPINGTCCFARTWLRF